MGMIPTEDRIRNRGIIFDPNDKTELNADNIMLIFDKMISGEYNFDKLNILGKIFAKGTVNQGETLGDIGSGAFMIFYPRKGAFRAGAVYGNQWDDDNIGMFSFAGGRDTIASGLYSVALGFQNTANNDSAVALGYNNTASGQQSFAAGLENIASGNRAVALGHQNIASGNGSVALGYQSYASAFGSVALGVSAQASGYGSSAIGEFAQAIGSGSVALGFKTKANSLYSIALGTYNLGLGNPTSWVDTDPILELGIGTSNSDRKNAVTILKNGNVGIGVSMNLPSKLTVAGSIGIQAGANAYIGTLDNYGLSLRTNNVDRVYITNDGKVGIETNPNSYGSKFAVVDNSNINDNIRIITGFTPNLNVGYYVWLGLGKSYSLYNSGWIGFKYVGNQSTNNFLSFGLYSADNILVITGNRNVGIRTTSPSYALQVGTAGDGTSAIANAWNTFSDIRLKEVIGEIKSDEALEKILNLQAKRFYYKNDENKKEYVGFIAQEVEEYIPEVVSTDDTEEQYKAIAYEKIIPFLVEAVKQLYKLYQELKDGGN
jgi:hypothetical protein